MIHTDFSRTVNYLVTVVWSISPPYLTPSILLVLVVNSLLSKTTSTFDHPMHSLIAEIRARARGLNNSVGMGLSALVVEDNPLTRRIHKALLERYGLETQLATNGEEAVALHRSGAHFHLVLMDQEMPVKDGVTATRELREMGVRSKIVGVTSHGIGAVRDEFMAAGLDECLMKPLNADEVCRLVGQIMTSSTTTKD